MNYDIIFIDDFIMFILDLMIPLLSIILLIYMIDKLIIFIKNMFMKEDKRIIHIKKIYKTIK